MAKLKGRLCWLRLQITNSHANSRPNRYTTCALYIQGKRACSSGADSMANRRTKPSSSLLASSNCHSRCLANPCLGKVASRRFTPNHGKHRGTPPRMAAPSEKTALGLSHSQSSSPTGANDNNCAPCSANTARHCAVSATISGKACSLPYSLRLSLTLTPRGRSIISIFLGGGRRLHPQHIVRPFLKLVIHALHANIIAPLPQLPHNGGQVLRHTAIH